MEKRIIIAFVLSMILVSIYNAVVLKPLQEKKAKQVESTAVNSPSVGQGDGKEISPRTKLDLPKDLSWNREVDLEDGKAWISEKGLFMVEQRVPGASEDVRLSFSPPLLYSVDKDLSWQWSVDGNSLKAVAGLSGKAQLVCAYLPHPKDLPKRYARYYEGIILRYRDGRLRRIPLSKVRGSVEGEFTGVGLYSKYYLAYLWTEQGQIDGITIKEKDGGTLILGGISGTDKPGLVVGIYAGLGRQEFMKGVPEAKRVVKRGMLSGITDVLWIVLKMLYKFTHNWGLSIVLLAVLFSLAFLPLTIKSYTAMKKLQAMQPEMKALQEKYKDDPQRLNQELMLLYAKYGVNPLSGCLPLLLQLPVFFALYPLLLNTYEFKGSSFLWIKDLSRPDVIFSVGGFEVHLLPLIVVAIMALQQRFSSAGQGQQNQTMLLLFPILFLVIFYNMPSGLVLFWLVMSLINIAQQVFIIKNIKV